MSSLQPVISQKALSEAARSHAALSGAAPAQAGAGTPQPVLSRLISDRLDILHTISCIRVVGTRPSVGVTRLVAYLSQPLADRHPRHASLMAAISTRPVLLKIWGCHRA